MKKGSRIKRKPLRAATGILGASRGIRATGTKKPKQKKIKIKDVDTVFSRFIRLSHADQNGDVQCFTCDFKASYKKLHAGHYISRYYKITRWNENNVKPQCMMCNIYKKGNAAIFRRNLVTLIGETAVQDMEGQIDHLVRGWGTRELLTPIFEEYTQKLSPFLHLTLTPTSATLTV